MRGVDYTSAIDSLMFAMVCTRLDIAHTVGVVSRFLSQSRQRTLENSKVDSQISQRHLQGMFMF